MPTQSDAFGVLRRKQLAEPPPGGHHHRWQMCHLVHYQPSTRQSRARSSYSGSPTTTSVSGFEMIPPQQPAMEIIEETFRHATATRWLVWKSL